MDLNLNSVKGIVPKVYGGLGNQMFIIAAAYIISKVQGCPLYLPKNPKNHMNAHNTGIDYYETIFKNIGIHLSEPESEVLKKLINYKIIHQDGFYPWNPSLINPGSVLDSYFQFYPSFEPFEKEIRNLFLSSLKNFFPEIEIKRKTAFLHIRRGDYLQKSNFHFVQPLSYYQKAVDILCKRCDVNLIYIFTDDVHWVKQQDLFKTPFFHIIEEANELKALYLMASCKAGAICANSTFSWWGAFLGAHEEKNPVIVPEKWIACNVFSLFPEEWIVI